MFDLQVYLADCRKRVEEALDSYLGGSACASTLSRAMHYAVMAGGKRLRPVLCIAAAETVGASAASVMPMACALELIHTYSLIHDDLPAMDDDDTRRGKATCHVRFDEPTAILAGDALLTLAFEVISRAGMQSEPDVRHRWLEALGSVACAAGCNGMIEGQMRDMAYEGKRIPMPELEAMHRLKTGRMIEISVQSGAIIAAASKTAQNALLSYAGKIGLAFQVTDDLLNIKGDPQKLGKAVGTDQMRGKNTYPALIGLEAAEAYAQRLVDDALSELDVFDIKADPLRAIAQYIIERRR
ncbi:MAG: farnesyl-diphosphate synthase [Deltaproteobacteria bacterium]|nr:MAG: farnesyl-diphosphate synthase [Deltaproteobacteria bacterium]